MYSIEFVETIGNKKAMDEIYKILCECEGEFVPPLSLRNDPAQTCFHDTPKDMNESTSYFDKMMKQRFIIDQLKNQIVENTKFLLFVLVPLASLYVTWKIRNRSRRKRYFCLVIRSATFPI